MKLNRSCLLFTLLLLSTTVMAQQANPVFLRSGTFQAQKNIQPQIIDSFNATALRIGNKTLAVVQFESIPSESMRRQLSKAGIELLEYIPQNTYTVSINGHLNLQVLQQAKAQSLFQLQPKQKMELRLTTGNIPSWASKIPGTVDLWISFPKTLLLPEVLVNLKEKNIDVISDQNARFRILSVRIAAERVEELASYPFVEFVQLAPKGDEPLLFNSRAGSRANLLNAPVAAGGKGLNGEEVVIGVGDNADIQTHADFSRRVINRAPMPLTAGHGHHVSGIAAGAGNIYEPLRGYATKSTIVSQGYNGIILNAHAYVNDYGMVVTNNSYGDNAECTYFGTYDLYSRLLDEMAFELPELQNVFSSGNSGTASCAPFQPFYHTVLGGYQTAKNVITVGATTDSGAIGNFSSRGPVKDGRLKPEIVAQGQAVGSTWFNNLYGYTGGTSMASPAVTGGLALLIQRYRQLNAGANPKNGLMKAILCNGGADRGNAGPDYQYGYGWMNLLRSVEMIENGRYFTATVANGGNNTHSITVPANTSQLKVMLYWNDPAASPLAAKTLVNDLDLEVNDGVTTILPKILDTTNANLGVASFNGIDRLNNIEQVVINNPVAGNYSINIKGFAVTQNPSQEYFVAYDFVPTQLKITSPAGGQAWNPTTNAFDMMRISWEALGLGSGTANLEYSIDGGSNWISIATNIDVNRSLFSWIVPNVATDNALVRITKNGTGETSTSGRFTIVGIPAISWNAAQCEGYANISWTSVTGATDYEVMILRGDEMVPVGVSTGNSFAISGLDKDSLYWVTVRARINGNPGLRAYALARVPNDGACTGNVSDNDLKIDAILAPSSGRRFTASQLTATTAISVRIKNLDNAPVTGFQMKYSINGGAFVTEAVGATVNAGTTYTHTFTTTADLSMPGDYHLVVVVKNNTADVVTVNDTAYRLVKHLDNQPIDLTTAFLDNMETATADSYERDTLGLNGLPRYDFSRSSIYGRLRPFVNSGIAYSGSKALTLDASRLHIAGNTNYLIGTFNLINYNVAANDIRLDFQYNNHGQFPHANNKVWIRGNDAQPWIEAFDLDNNQNDPGSYKRSNSIEVSDLLAANGQSLGTSFQARWGQWGQIAATDKENAGGYSFDDVRLYEVFNDLQMISIDSPITASCALTNATTIGITVRNSSNAVINNVPVRYRINNGSWISETIPSIAANASLQYLFVAKADLSVVGPHHIETLVDLAADSFRDNDTARVTIVNSPVITSFPYLENFESGAASWYTGGKKPSWEYGTPASYKIRGAASGAKAWKTRLVGNYNDMEWSYLYSPCFDLTGMTTPTLSFSLALDIEDCGTDLCDGAWVEYSEDGVTWIKLGAANQGTNWYNKTTHQLWSVQNFSRWHVATIPLPVNISRLRLRIVMESDPAVNREGVAIDDIHIYDNTAGIYDGVTMGAPATQTVSGNSWTHFSSGGKLVASIQPNNQNMGSTDVQAYIHAGAVRFTPTQYYHNRNITIQPANTTLSDSVTVRFYFLDTEVDTLVKATGCNGCTKPTSAYDLGVSKYTDPNKTIENGSASDNVQGLWSFIPAAQVKMVPFDKGYYAEFKVLDFSEFWLNNGGFNNLSPLPVKLLDFIAQKQNNDVVVKWKTSGEVDVDRYEIEVARGDAAVQAGDWTRIGAQVSLGNTNATRDYSFTDTEADKFGTRFYRLRIINKDGSLVYSPVRAVVFTGAVLWQVYPNPSPGMFNLVYQLAVNETMRVNVLDAKGRLIRTYTKTGNGIAQKLGIDLTMLAAGTYLLQTDIGGKSQSFKLYKQ